MQHFRSSRWLLQSESNVRFQLLMQQESWKTCKHDKGSSPVLFFPVMYKVLKQEVVLMLDLLWADRTLPLPSVWADVHKGVCAVVWCGSVKSTHLSDKWKTFSSFYSLTDGSCFQLSADLLNSFLTRLFPPNWRISAAFHRQTSAHREM